MKKKKTTVPTQPTESPDFNSEQYTYNPFLFVHWKQQKWINIPGSTCRQIEKDLMDLMNAYNMGSNKEIRQIFQNTFDDLGYKAGMLFWMLEQCPGPEKLIYDHVFIDWDIEELKDILNMEISQLKSAVKTLIDNGILKVDKTLSFGKYKLDSAKYEEYILPLERLADDEAIKESIINWDSYE
jgi:hypothetical protein